MIADPFLPNRLIAVGTGRRRATDYSEQSRSANHHRKQLQGLGSRSNEMAICVSIAVSNPGVWVEISLSDHSEQIDEEGSLLLEALYEQRIGQEQVPEAEDEEPEEEGEEPRPRSRGREASDAGPATHPGAGRPELKQRAISPARANPWCRPCPCDSCADTKQRSVPRTPGRTGEATTPTIAAACNSTSRDRPHAVAIRAGGRCVEIEGEAP